MYCSEENGHIYLLWVARGLLNLALLPDISAWLMRLGEGLTVSSGATPSQRLRAAEGPVVSSILHNKE